eukprot:jgi/Ulvmu1/1480/UM011_0210.1
MALWSAIVSVALPLVIVAVVLLFACQLTRCGVPLVSTNRLYKDKRERITLAGWAWHDANDLSTSPWFGSKGIWVVLGYRCYLVAIFFLVIVLEVVQGTATSKWATFFTNWTFVAFFIHAAFGVVQSVRGIKRGALRPEAEGWVWLPYDWLDKLHSIIAVSVITIHLHVAIFYWAALYPGHIEADGVFKHAVNAVLLQIELWISSFPWTVPWVIFPTTYILVYAIYMWIWHTAEESWVYDALDYGKTSAPAMYFGVSILVLFAFLICWLGAWVRERQAKKKFLPAVASGQAMEKKAALDHEVELGSLPQ